MIIIEEERQNMYQTQHHHSDIFETTPDLTQTNQNPNPLGTCNRQKIKRNTNQPANQSAAPPNDLR